MIDQSNTIVKAKIPTQKQWETHYQKSAGNRYPEPPIVRFIARNYFSAPDRSRVRILDLGCGGGNHTYFLARERFTAYGLDFSKQAIQWAKKRLREDGLKASFRVGDIQHLPYKDGFFDAVIDAAAMQHNSPAQIGKILTEVHRTLKPGGKFFGTLIADHRGLSDSRFTTHFFKAGEIRKLFSKFKNVAVDYYEYSEDSSRKFIRFWLVEAQKAKARSLQ